MGVSELVRRHAVAHEKRPAAWIEIDLAERERFQSDSRCCRATDYRLCLNPSASGTRRRRQWAGRRDACTPSFAAAVWEIVQISRLRPDRESEVCLPSFLPSTTARLRGVGLR